MYFLLLGLALSLLKYLEVGVVATWGWWTVLSPFGMAIVWWWWADFSGYTKRRSMAREDDRKQKRIDEGRKRLGLPPTAKRK